MEPAFEEVLKSFLVGALGGMGLFTVLFVISSGSTLRFPFIKRRNALDDSRVFVVSMTKSIASFNEDLISACVLMRMRYLRANEVATKRMVALLVLLLYLIIGLIYVAMVQSDPYIDGVGNYQRNTFTFVSQLTVKIAVVGIILYIVGILYKDFRYQKKVADFYRSRFDGIILRNVLQNFEDIQGWMDLTNPPYDISATNPPLSEVLEAASKVKGLAKE